MPPRSSGQWTSSALAFFWASGWMVVTTSRIMSGTSNVSSMQVQLARLDLGQVEHVVDQREQVLGRPVDLLQVGEEVVEPAVGRLLLEQLGVQDDGVERGAQLVAHVGQELALGAVGDLGRLPGLVQLAHVAEDADGADHPPVRVAQRRGVERRRDGLAARRCAG